MNTNIQTIFVKKINDIILNNDYDILITSDTDCYKYSNNNDKNNAENNILFKFRKNVIPEDMSKNIQKIYLKHANKINNQRAKASGGHIIKIGNATKSSEVCKSSIVGYYDQPPIKYKKLLYNKGVTQNICRETLFTRDNKILWKTSLDFFKLIAKLYKKLAPNFYNTQLKAIKTINKNYRIQNTPFTTITINYNWKTNPHKDKGDFKYGLSVLVVLGKNYKGGYLVFPEYKIAVDVRPGDIIIMDSHEYHCNTNLVADDINYRLSFVCYLREGMLGCNTKIVIKDNIYYYKKSNKK